MSDTETKDVPMAECGSCRAIIPLDSKKCPECGIGFSGVSDEALGECGACNSLVPLDSKSCPECGVFFVADDVLSVLGEWFENTGIEARKLFSKFDSDSDGSIDAEELKDGLLKMKLADLPPSQIDRLISQVDTDNDGVISLDELVAAISGEEPEEVDSVDTIATKQYSENVVERIIKKYSIEDKADFLSYAASFDENDNDYLTEAELKKAAEAYSDETTTENDTITDEAESTESESVESEENEPEDVGVVEADDVESEENTDENMDVGDEVSDDDEDKEDQSVEQQHEDVEESETTSDEHLRTLVTAAVDQDMTIRSMFESMDLDENGLIDGPELQKGISSIVGDYLSPGDIMGIISLVDKDSNGRIDAFELIEVIESMEIEIESDVAVKPIDLLTDFMDSMEINPGSFFRKLDKNGDGKINRIELSEALKEQANDDADDETISELISMFDEDGDESIDLIEFISTLEEESDEEPDEESSLSVPKEFPSKWQKRMISKRWKDVVWPLIHTGFAFFILLWVVNGTLAPFVDGNGGTVILDTEFGQTIGDDNTVYVNGDPYPCNDEIQIGGCENSLTPFAGEDGELSMPAGFYWDGILFIILGVVGLIGSLFTQLSLVPAWRARVKAMRDNEADKEEVAQALTDSDEIAESEDDDSDDESNEDVAENDDSDDSETDETADEDYEEDEIDIGSFIGLMLEDEEVFGTIIEFDDEEGLVTIEEDGTGDLVTGYQEDMFIED